MSSPYRSHYVELEFSDSFSTWMITLNFHGDYTCDFLCNGWEL